MDAGGYGVWRRMIPIYVRYDRLKLPDGRKFYFARLHKDLHSRILRKVFKRANDAMEYGKRVAERWERIYQ